MSPLHWHSSSQEERDVVFVREGWWDKETSLGGGERHTAGVSLASVLHLSFWHVRHAFSKAQRDRATDMTQPNISQMQRVRRESRRKAKGKEEKEDREEQSVWRTSSWFLWVWQHNEKNGQMQQLCWQQIMNGSESLTPTKWHHFHWLESRNDVTDYGTMV